jgi:hypothetical protein
MTKCFACSSCLKCAFPQHHNVRTQSRFNVHCSVFSRREQILSLTLVIAPRSLERYRLFNQVVTSSAPPTLIRILYSLPISDRPRTSCTPTYCTLLHYLSFCWRFTFDPTPITPPTNHDPPHPSYKDSHANVVVNAGCRFVGSLKIYNRCRMLLFQTFIYFSAVPASSSNQFSAYMYLKSTVETLSMCTSEHPKDVVWTGHSSGGSPCCNHFWCLLQRI